MLTLSDNATAQFLLREYAYELHRQGLKFSAKEAERIVEILERQMHQLAMKGKIDA